MGLSSFKRIVISKFCKELKTTSYKKGLMLSDSQDKSMQLTSSRYNKASRVVHSAMAEENHSKKLVE